MAKKKKKRVSGANPNIVVASRVESENGDDTLEPENGVDALDEPTYDYDDGETYYGHDSHGWAPYRTVAQQRAEASRQAKKLSAAGQTLDPVAVSGRKLTKTFWGEAWCRNLEQHHDYESRLPRGRSYLRNGAVIDLQLHKGGIAAQVLGSQLYTVEIGLTQLDPEKWKDIVAKCTGNVGSILELLTGKLSDEVMKLITDEETGLFPAPDEITMSCSCPDWATMCKHVAATLYGVGVRLDERPAMFFTLRGVDHNELIASSTETLAKELDAADIDFNREELEGLFGIEINL